VAARLNFYAAAAQAISQKPLGGYGLENGGEVFIKYYKPNWALYGDVNASADRAHNLILDILLTTGFWGLFFFLLLYGYFFKLAFLNIRQTKNKLLSLAITLGAAAYLLSLLFSFTIVAGEVYFWLFLALLIVLNISPREQNEMIFPERINSGRFWPVIISLIIIALVFWQIKVNFRILMADHYFNKLYYTLAERDYSTSFSLFNHIQKIKVNSLQSNFYDRFLGDKLSDFYGSIDELAVKAEAQEKLEKIEERLPETGYENWLIKGKINAVLGNFAVAKQYFSRLTDYTPHWPQAHFEQARMLKAQNDLESAARSYYLAEINLPDLNNPHLSGRQRAAVTYYLAVIYQELGNTYMSGKNYALAEKYYQLAYFNNPANFTLLKNIADTYYFRQDWERAKEYNQRGFKRNPQDYNWLVALAALEKEEDNEAQALFYLDEALKLAPANTWLQEMRLEYK
jgi:tetratricopeptide (TPR) repeat protein